MTKFTGSTATAPAPKRDLFAGLDPKAAVREMMRRKAGK